MPSLRLGCDLCQIVTIKQILSDDSGLLDRLFNPEERAYAMTQTQPEQHLAGAFAAKEALAKAVREPKLLGKYQKEVTVSHRDEGVPYLRPSDGLARVLAEKGINIVDLSISHDGDYAMAAVLVEVTDSSGSENEHDPNTKARESSRNTTAINLRCYRCLLTLKYLSDQRIADFLIKVEDKNGGARYLCPVCVRGW